MARKQKIADKKGEDALVKTLKTLFKKEYPELVPFARGGVRLFNYIFDATKAADKVPVPKGFKMNPVEVVTSTVRGKQEAKVVEIIVALLEEALGAKVGALPDLPESNVHYSYAVPPARRSENATPDTHATILFDRLKEIILDSLGTGIDPTEVVPAAKFVEDLGCDSLDLIETVMAIEEAFAIEIADEDAEKIITVGDAYDYLRKLPGVRTFPDKNYQCTGIV